MIVTETKLDETFTNARIKITGYCEPYRLDRNGDGGGAGGGGGGLIFIREGVPSKRLTEYTFPSDVEALLIEVNLRKIKILLIGAHHPPTQTDQYYFDCINRVLDLYADTCEKVFLAGDFNAQVTEACISDFLFQNDLTNIVKENTYFKNPVNPTCIDLFLTNFPRSFQNTTAVTTGLSDFHKMTSTVLKSSFIKLKPKTLHYRCYKKFNCNDFRKELKAALASVSRYGEFQTKYLSILNKHAPIKMKSVRANQAPYMTKTLSKAIMTRSSLKNKLYKNFTRENNRAYKKQRNYCSRLYKKERKKYYENLNVKNITDNKVFWKTVKPFLSEKGYPSSKILWKGRPLFLRTMMLHYI